MPVLLNGYLKGLIGLTRHNEISAEFAFRGSNLFLVSKRCLSAKSAARSHSFLLTATVPMRSMWTVMPPDPPSAFVSRPLYWLRASTAVKPLTIHFRPELFTAIVVFSFSSLIVRLRFCSCIAPRRPGFVRRRDVRHMIVALA
jgi:hypothetical protein